MNLIDEIDALAKRASQGKCRVDPCWSNIYLDVGQSFEPTLEMLHYPAGFNPRPDLELLVALRNSWPNISRALRAAEAMLPYVSSGDLFGANRYSAEAQATHAFRQALAELEGK